MMKVLLNTFIAIICWWACGYGIAFGKGSDFIGKENYGGSGFRFSHHISHWSNFRFFLIFIIIFTIFLYI